jgi:hypothetical protein
VSSWESLMSHVRTDNPWSHGCRLTSRASAGRHQAPDAGARLVAAPQCADCGCGATIVMARSKDTRQAQQASEPESL